MSRLQNKQCPLYKEPCLLSGCAMYDERLDACVVNLMAFNMYKVAHAIEKNIPEPRPYEQGRQPSSLRH